MWTNVVYTYVFIAATSSTTTISPYTSPTTTTILLIVCIIVFTLCLITLTLLCIVRRRQAAATTSNKTHNSLDSLAPIDSRKTSHNQFIPTHNKGDTQCCANNKCVDTADAATRYDDFEPDWIRQLRTQLAGMK
jgi:ABC-type transport system involved in Fe-S cluster assembly fused permease/ATPase subunit